MPHLFSSPYRIDCASEEANFVLNNAVKFARTHDPTYVPDRDMLVAQHVKIQLSCLETDAYATDGPFQEIGRALADLAETCREEGVKVKVAQPWHRGRD
tara:strand:- start:1341 stop:1637 length:297 start_codon:yes stop_codon:yes gene_type:complete